MSLGTPAPVAHRDRLLAPDLARGLLLAFIAVANVWGYLYGREVGAGYRPLDASVLDRWVNGLVAFFVDDRSRPMFAIMLGFGLATIARRAAERGTPPRAVTWLLVRRNLALIGLGLLHAGLLFGGDILTVYGVTGLLAIAVLRRRRAVLLRWFWVSLAMMLALDTVFALVPTESGPDVPTSDYLRSVGERLLDDSILAVLAGVALYFGSQLVLGVLLARSGWLDRPGEHVPQLRAVLGWTALANLVGNLPHALAVAGLWQPRGGVAALVALLHAATGVAMGFGYVCLFALVVVRLAGRPHPAPVRAVAALGERSLSGYLAQSMVLAPLLSAWGLGLGARIGTAAATGLALLTWLLTVLAAASLDRAGLRGPFEVLLRRLTYGRAASPSGRPAAAEHTAPVQQVASVETATGRPAPDPF